MRLRLLAVPALVAVAGLAVTSSGAGGAVGTSPNCVVRNHHLAIIDDSASMAQTDPNRLRVAGVNVFTNLPGNANKTLSGEEFGTQAQPLFGQPGTSRFPMGLNRGAIANVLNQRIVANAGLTNYNAAFALAKSFGVSTGAPPPRTGTAPRDAWIFLTDGGHGEGPYQNAHQGGPVTEVVGLGASITGPNEARLQQIATETGGTYQKASDASTIQEAFVNIDADLSCRARPTKKVIPFSGRVGEEKRESTNVGANDTSVNLTATWTNAAGDQFDFASVRMVDNKNRVVGARVKRRKLKLTRRRGATFTTLKVNRVKRARKLRFRIKAKKLAQPGVPVAVTVQVSKAKKRKR